MPTQLPLIRLNTLLRTPNLPSAQHTVGRSPCRISPTHIRPLQLVDAGQAKQQIQTFHPWVNMRHAPAPTPRSQKFTRIHSRSQTSHSKWDSSCQAARKPPVHHGRWAHISKMSQGMWIVMKSSTDFQLDRTQMHHNIINRAPTYKRRNQRQMRLSDDWKDDIEVVHMIKPSEQSTITRLDLTAFGSHRVFESIQARRQQVS